MGGPSGHAWGIPRPDQRDKERERRLQEARTRPGEGRSNMATETTMQRSQRAADGSAVSTVTKTERLVHSSKGPSRAQGGNMSAPLASMPLTPFFSSPAPPDDGTRTARTTTVESSFVRRSESKAAWHHPVPARLFRLFLKLYLCTFICVSVCLVTFSSLPVATSILRHSPLPHLLMSRPGPHSPCSSVCSCRWWRQHHGANQDCLLIVIQKDGQVSTGAHAHPQTTESVPRGLGGGLLTIHPFHRGID